MNSHRRKAINRIIKDIDDLKEKAESWATWTEAKGNDELDDISGRISDLKDEEQESYDNMPEALQTGDKGDQSQAAIDALQEAESAIDELEIEEDDFDGEALAEALEDVTSFLQEAMA